MSDRRNFLKQTSAAVASLSFMQLANPVFASEFSNRINRIKDNSVSEVAQDEDFWNYIRECFSVSQTIINFNNGGVSPQPKVVQEAHIDNYRFCNQGPSYYMWRILDQGREPLRNKLADYAGCSAEEIAINRNSTEGLNNIIFGLDLKASSRSVSPLLSALARNSAITDSAIALNDIGWYCRLSLPASIFVAMSRAGGVAREQLDTPS